MKDEKDSSSFVSRKRHAIKGECTIALSGPFTMEELAKEGIFRLDKKVCRVCGKHFPGKCMGIYNAMKKEDQFRIEAIVDNVSKVKKVVVDCSHRIPVNAAS